MPLEPSALVKCRFQAPAILTQWVQAGPSERSPVMELRGFQELVLLENRAESGRASLSPFTLTSGHLLASGHLTAWRAHRGLIEGCHLEGCARARPGRHPCSLTGSS